MASEPTPEQSYCASEARRNDWERFICTLFAPRDAREALFCLIAFNSELTRTRDVVSQALLGQIRLQWWRDAIAAIYGEMPPSAATATHPILVPLARAIQAHKLDRAVLDAMIDARSDEFDDDGIIRDPAGYIDATAVNLARLQMQVLSNGRPVPPPTLAAAEQANAAWGYVELIRLGRLPAEDIAHAQAPITAARTQAGAFDKIYLSVLLPATLAASHLAHPNAGRARRQIGLAVKALRGKF